MNKLFITLILIIPLLTFSQESKSMRDARKKREYELCLAKLNKPKIFYKYANNDKDKDGIIDTKDNCPNVYGEMEDKGCPDYYAMGVVEYCKYDEYGFIKARNFFELALKNEMSVSKSNFHLGMMYHWGQGVDKNLNIAISYYKAALKNERAANYTIGLIYQEKEDSLCLKYFEASCNDGNESGCYELTILYRGFDPLTKIDNYDNYGNNNWDFKRFDFISKNAEKSDFYLEKSAYLGKTEAIYLKAIKLYHLNEKAKAKELFNQACDNKFNKACEFLIKNF